MSQACLASISLCVRLYGRVSAYRAIVHSVADWPALVLFFCALVLVCTVVFSAYRAIVHRFVFFPMASQGPSHLADVQSAAAPGRDSGFFLAWSSEAVAGDAEASLQ